MNSPCWIFEVKSPPIFLLLTFLHNSPNWTVAFPLHVVRIDEKMFHISCFRNFTAFCVWRCSNKFCEIAWWRSSSHFSNKVLSSNQLLFDRKRAPPNYTTSKIVCVSGNICSAARCRDIWLVLWAQSRYQTVLLFPDGEAASASGWRRDGSVGTGGRRRRRRAAGLLWASVSSGMEQQSGIFSSPGGVQRRARQRLEVSVSVPPERRRWADLAFFGRSLMFRCESSFCPTLHEMIYTIYSQLRACLIFLLEAETTSHWGSERTFYLLYLNRNKTLNYRLSW